MEQALNELVYRAACAAYDQRSAGQAQSSQSLSVFLFDIDNFKNYNDTNGHLAGDKLLQELAGLVNDSVRKDDIFRPLRGRGVLLILPIRAPARRRWRRRRSGASSPTTPSPSGEAAARAHQR